MAFGGLHAPEISFAAIGVLVLAWIAWSMIKGKASGIRLMDCPASHTRPEQTFGVCAAVNLAPERIRWASCVATVRCQVGRSCFQYGRPALPRDGGMPKKNSPPLQMARAHNPCLGAP
jgi:hypothetical protein